ncbi:terminase gpP N-terminus-related DNA-binding protein, partial [Aeromonas enteropelogenes]|uniref:terminase gpP N-terminus-related DNA-binding protein n=1 Tax=Aeromonas enteropelogenes TaxID=29489 RepID=UPI003B9E8750
MAYNEEIQRAARRLYLKRWTPQEIKDELGLGSVRVVYRWAERGDWASLLSEEALEDAITRRYQVLAAKKDKTHLDL